MKKGLKEIRYSRYYRDESLPPLKDLVSTTEDPEKSKIISYLNMDCFLGNPIRERDEIDRRRIAGNGLLYTDGTYVWDDVFAKYVERYNIPVPEEFRTHILNNYDARMKRHALLDSVDCVKIRNIPTAGRSYNVSVNRSGKVLYQNNSDTLKETGLSMKKIDVKYMINVLMKFLFCYDSDNHGNPLDELYYWEITFCSNDVIIDKIYGRFGEDLWRFSELKEILKYLAYYIPYSLGTEYMDYYSNTDEGQRWYFYNYPDDADLR